MRGLRLCKATLVLFALVPANTFVLPDDALGNAFRKDTVGNRADGFADGGGQFEDTELVIPTLTPDNEAVPDPVAAWVNGVETPDSSFVAVLTTTLFPSMTTSSYLSQVTPSPHEPYTPSSTSNSRIPLEPDSASEAAPEAVPVFLENSQRPLGTFKQALRLAKVKAKAIVKFIGNKFECPADADQIRLGSNVQQPTDLPSEKFFDVPTALAEPAETAYSSVVVTTVPPAQATPGHYSPSSPLSVPTATSTYCAPKNPPSNSETSFPNSNIDRYYSGILIGCLIITCLVAGLILAIFRCRDPRKRVERLERFEERKRQRLYRRAVCKHKFKIWRDGILSKIWFGARLAQSNISDKDVSYHAQLERGGPLGQEIRSFQQTHEYVRTLIQAEEGGRVTVSRDSPRTMSWLFGGRRRVNSDAASQTSSVPPPPYEDHARYEKVDEHTFVRVSRGRRRSDCDSSSVSSVIPTSPRTLSLTLGPSDVESLASDKE